MFFQSVGDVDAVDWGLDDGAEGFDQTVQKEGEGIWGEQEVGEFVEEDYEGDFDREFLFDDGRKGQFGE